MKKTIIVIATIIGLLLIFTFPIPIVHSDIYGEGSVVSFNSLTYQIVKWDMYPNSLKPYQHTDFYFAPNNFNSVEKLWEKRQNDLRNDGYGAILSYAIVTEKNATGVLVDEISEDKLTTYNTIYIGKTQFEKYNISFDDIEVDTKLKITYDGMVLDIYPGDLNRIYKIELYE